MRLCRADDEEHAEPGDGPRRLRRGHEWQSEQAEGAEDEETNGARAHGDLHRILPVASLRAHDFHLSLPLLSSYHLSRMKPNADAHLLPEAGAQRTLEGVGSSAWFG